MPRRLPTPYPMLNPYQMAEYYRQAAVEVAVAQEEAQAQFEAAAQAHAEAHAPGGEQQAPPPGVEAQVGVVVLGGPPNIVEVPGEQFREHLAAEKSDKHLIGQFLQNDRIVREHIDVAVQINDARDGEESGEEEDISGRSFDPDGSDSDDSGVGVHSDEE